MMTLDPYDSGTWIDSALTLTFTELLGTTVDGYMWTLAQKDPHSSLYLPGSQSFPANEHFQELACEGLRQVARYSLGANIDSHFIPFRTLEWNKVTLIQQGVVAFMPAMTLSKRTGIVKPRVQIPHLPLCRRQWLALLAKHFKSANLFKAKPFRDLGTLSLCITATPLPTNKGAPSSYKPTLVCFLP